MQNSGFLLLSNFLNDTINTTHTSNAFKQNACRYTTVFSIIALQLKLPVKAKKKKELHGFHVFKMFKRKTSKNSISLNKTLKSTREFYLQHFRHFEKFLLLQAS